MCKFKSKSVFAMAKIFFYKKVFATLGYETITKNFLLFCIDQGAKANTAHRYIYNSKVTVTSYFSKSSINEHEP
jgi:hypothetical protein